MKRSEAKALGLKTYNNDKPCPKGHPPNRYTSNGCCVECKKREIKKKPTPDEIAKKAAYMKNYMVNYRAEKRDKINGIKRAYYKRNRESLLEKSKKYRDENSHKYVELCRRRRIKIDGATPSWLSICQKDEIINTYLQCKNITSSTGIPHHVDHIIPINSDIVCGLHVPWNLQIVTAEYNVRKSNRLLNEHD